jgi:hypothetical protein
MVRVNRRHPKLMFLTIFREDPDSVTDFHDLFLPDSGLKFIRLCLDGLQGSAPYQVYNYQDRNEFLKNGLLYHGGFRCILTKQITRRFGQVFTSFNGPNHEFEA